MFDLPEKHFQAIAADPPWTFKTRSKKGEGRTPQSHYDTMTADEIARLPVEALAAKDCFLFLWSTWPHLRQALHIMDSWGFTYSGSGFVWVKQRRNYPSEQLAFHSRVDDDLHLGCGYTTRKNTEFVLLGRKGYPKRKSAAVREVIVSPVRLHSQKPDEFFSRVETFCDGPYLELFSRTDRPNWTTWGNQAGSLNEAVA
jgi:N6-adenosine-specific RNA methylase IME4